MGPLNPVHAHDLELKVRVKGVKVKIMRRLFKLAESWELVQSGDWELSRAIVTFA